MADAGIDWVGILEMIARLTEYENKTMRAVYSVAVYWTSELENYAKDNASWTDQTGNARNALRGYIGDQPPSDYSAADAIPYPEATNLAENVVAIYLAHGMSYGVFLELANQGIYGIINETLQAHYDKIKSMLDEIFQ
jgi:hypothetical protein